MLLKEVFPYLTLASCQHGVSQTCKLIIAQLRMKSISWKALSPFLFSETGSESKQNRSHSYKVQKCMCIHLFFWHHLKWSISMNKCGNVSCSLKELSEISNFNFQLWIFSEEEHIGVVILDFCDISVNVAKIGQSVAWLQEKGKEYGNVLTNPPLMVILMMILPISQNCFVYQPGLVKRSQEIYLYNGISKQPQICTKNKTSFEDFKSKVAVRHVY